MPFSLCAIPSVNESLEPPLGSTKPVYRHDDCGCRSSTLPLTHAVTASMLMKLSMSLRNMAEILRARARHIALHRTVDDGSAAARG